MTRRGATRIAYRVGMPRPHTHLFEVAMTVDDPGGPVRDFVLPSWTPGSYLVRDYARHVRDFTAESAGRPLPWRKTAKDCWRVRTGESRRVRIRYRVYAHEISVRTCHLDGTHGFLTGAAAFMYVPGRTAEPARLEIDAPRGWTVATGLEPSGSGHVASDYDELVDCPVECGPHRRLEFSVDRRPHEIAIWGHGNEDERRLVADVRAIVRAQRDFFGGLPYRRYAFIVHLASGRGGLEHRNSSVLLADRWSFRPDASYERFLALVAHEFFHVWNVKRIRPQPLGPFDYRRENYSRNLWIVEGLTSYYQNRFLLAAGLIDFDRWLELLAEGILALDAVPGRAVQSLEEASHDAWIRLYRPDENSPNVGVSYYLKGALVAFALDLEIRHLTRGRRSLDDVVRRLHEAYPPDRPGFPEDGGFLGVVEEVAGRHDGAFARFVERFVAGRDELDLDRVLSYAGLRAVRAFKRSRGSEGPPAWLGLNVQRSGERTVVASVRADGPAYEAGIYAGDEIVALDGRRVDETSLAARLEETKPGTAVRVSVFRRDDLIEIPVATSAGPRDALRLERLRGASPLQKRIRRGLEPVP